MTLEQARESLRRYVDHGLPPGGFLMAVLCNDLYNAIARADDTSVTNLRAICRHVYNELPGNCWGTRDKVEQWLKRATRGQQVTP